LPPKSSFILALPSALPPPKKYTSFATIAKSLLSIMTKLRCCKNPTIYYTKLGMSTPQKCLAPQLFCGWWAFFYALHFGGSKSGLHACLLACTRNLLAGVPECLPCVADFGKVGFLSGTRNVFTPALCKMARATVE
jgi:hypothetical protein